MIAAVGVCAWIGCKGKGDTGSTKGLSADVVMRCEALGEACGDSDKHDRKITKECEQAAKEPVAKGCTKETIAVYNCYQKQLCGKKDKIWALNDLRVLSKRHRQCLAERKVRRECVHKRKRK